MFSWARSITTTVQPIAISGAAIQAHSTRRNDRKMSQLTGTSRHK